MADMKKEIGERIRELRVKARLSQEELGHLAFGYGKNDQSAAQQKILKIEKGKVNISIDELVLIAGYFRVPVNYLIGKSSVSPEVPPIEAMIDILKKVYALGDADIIDSVRTALISILRSFKMEEELRTLKDGKTGDFQKKVAKFPTYGKALK